ncbi:thap-type zinc finger superfamily [Holotrichia oblita]|uniref:Thap-type zinc finger superfamily n=1 Tax=Holotrichia oblita TaxID=644536 RepID=A0ACB9TVP9_HOLOL|nr:thap-type zinc finger superfamily [Holotrichia oblita]
MGKIRRCSVFGCQSQEGNVTLYSFPNPVKDLSRFLSWVSATGDELLLRLQPEEILRRCRICKNHFNIEDMFSVKLQEMAIPKLHLPDLLQVPNDWPDKAVQETATTSEHTTIDVSTEFWPTTYSASPAKQTASPRMHTTPAKIPENPVSSTSLTGNISRTLFPIDVERITMPEKMEVMRSDSLNEPSTSRGILISHEKDYGPTETNDVIRAVNRKKVKHVDQETRRHLKALKRRVLYHQKRSAAYKTRLAVARKESYNIENLSPMALQLFKQKLELFKKSSRQKIFFK